MDQDYVNEASEVDKGSQSLADAQKQVRPASIKLSARAMALLAGLLAAANPAAAFQAPAMRSPSLSTSVSNGGLSRAAITPHSRGAPMRLAANEVNGTEANLFNLNWDAQEAIWNTAPLSPNGSAARAATRSPPVTMMAKGKGKKKTRGLPGNRGQLNPMGGTTKKGKRKMQEADYSRSEWTLVAEMDELGAARGSTQAVAAGQTPAGQEYVWTVVRGTPYSRDDNAPEPTAFAIDGACRTCLFPLTNGQLSPENEPPAITCAACGTKYSLETGTTIDFLPARNPIQFASKLANQDKGEQKATVLPVRVSKTGRLYVRLPDGTLPISTRRVEGTLRREEIEK